MEEAVELLQNDEGSWRWTNKQMYTMYQSFAFKTIYISLNKPSKVFNSIMNSPCNPGQWVKTVHPSQLSPPDDLSSMNPVDDPLC